MLLKTILFFLALKTSILTEGAIRSGSNVKSSSSKVKEITLAIEHNLRDGHEQSNDSDKDSPSNRTRANLLINSKFIYPTESKRGAAFNQGILKFQQLLDLPINDTSNTQVTFINFDDKGGREVLNITEPNHTLTEILNITENNQSPYEKLNLTENHKIGPGKSKCGNHSQHSESENTTKLSEKKFIEDFESSNETSVETETVNKNVEIGKFNKSEEVSQDIFNKTLDVEFIPPLDIRNSNVSSDLKNSTKSSIEILDDNDEKNTNSSLNRTSYLNAKQKSASGKVIEIKSQTVEEIPLRSDLKNRANIRNKKQEEDEISQTIKRDILLGNLNPFFSNPSTSSIRNTNTLFFDDSITTPKSRALSATNPFIINSVALDTSSPSSFTRSKYSRLRTKSSKSFRKSAVETVPSISVDEGKKFSQPFADVGFSRASKQTTTVQNIPALLIKQEDKKPRFSSKYRSSRPSSSSAVSSVSFNIASPSVSKSRSSHTRTRSKSIQSFNRARTSNIAPIQTPSFNRPASPPSKISPSSSNVVEVLKSVEYSLPEEVGKSLTKTGAAKFKRKAGFERRQGPEYNVQKSVSMDPVTLNLHMTEKSDLIFNPYLVNSQLKKLNTQSSRSFDFKPSVPDHNTNRVAEFGSVLEKDLFFQPSSQFQDRTQSIPDVSNMIERPYFASDEVEDVNRMQRINNLESDIIFKPYFVAQPSRSFQMPETSSNRYNENDVQVIDLSQI